MRLRKGEECLPAILRDSKQVAQRGQVFALALRYVLFQVFEIECDEGRHFVLRFEQAIGGHPAARCGGGKKIARRVEGAFDGICHGAG